MGQFCRGKAFGKQVGKLPKMIYPNTLSWGIENFAVISAMMCRHFVCILRILGSRKLNENQSGILQGKQSGKAISVLGWM
jgi:hypothetical protein